MKRTLLATLAVTVLGATAFAAGPKQKVIGKNGAANILFSTEKIEKGKEDKAKLATSFTSEDVIWARAYFPKTFGTLEGEAEGFIDLWVDGKHVKRLTFSNSDVAADADQTVVYLHNTGNDDFKDEVWSEIGAGTHKVKLVIGKTEFLKAKVKLEVQDNDTVSAKRDDAYKAVYLAESDFTYVKK